MNVFNLQYLQIILLILFYLRNNHYFLQAQTISGFLPISPDPKGSLGYCTDSSTILPLSANNVYVDGLATISTHTLADLITCSSQSAPSSTWLYGGCDSSKALIIVAQIIISYDSFTSTCFASCEKSGTIANQHCATTTLTKDMLESAVTYSNDVCSTSSYSTGVNVVNFRYSKQFPSQPSSQPSRQPSNQPSRQPSGRPSCEPSKQPTSQPTSRPISIPTSQPSAQPSRRPSMQPTSQPSQQPSVQPSRQPTTHPSSQPSFRPSMQPSSHPSRQPTSCPSEQPSVQPSRQPSSQPSRSPSSQPSNRPSNQPSSRPSCQPTCQPTAKPSEQPSSKPTLQPVARPSAQPSSRPSMQPSLQPSNSPSCQPSRQPSAQPSVQPTSQPTSQPISVPTSQPSAQPSRRPSMQPTSQPSQQPSVQPSRQPTTHPSAQPSFRPSMQPSSHPSRQPTSCPSEQPSAQPSSRPSVQPSLQPSSSPTSQPSRQPSSQPSRQPSSQPSSQPSLQPTSQPTSRPSDQPSVQPTTQPSQRPSVQPSTAPSTQPSNYPSSPPSAQPTMRPTSWPTGYPTAQPLSNPSVQPSSLPTSQPVSLPSAQPSSNPTTQSTAQPTSFPSSQPSDVPSTQPSTLPTSQPSTLPSMQPSCLPTAEPTGFPSSQPSSFPTSQPSCQPTGVPSIQPTISPTGQPSPFPTGFPSLQPSGQPTSIPSMQPSSKPSSQPTSFPTTQPTCKPSSQPTSEPTIFPSNPPKAQPSLVPSSQPSSLPSVQPTVQPSNQPTMAPTAQPSSQPSRCPSRQPISRPSSQPSRQPSSRPTFSPSVYSDRPTFSPSNNGPVLSIPTVSPTLAPTVSPTTFLSLSPSSIRFKETLFILGSTLTTSSVISKISLPAMTNQQPDSVLVLGSNGFPDTIYIELPNRDAIPVQGSIVIQDTISRSVTVIGDINSDGSDDLMIGDPTSSRCFVYFGAGSGDWSNLAVSFMITIEDGSVLTKSGLGWAGAGLGDMNGDGYDDFIVTAPLVNAAYVIYGRRTRQFLSRLVLSAMRGDQGYKIMGGSQDRNFGMAVSSGGDFNRDRYRDIVVSSTLSSSSTQGNVYILLGNRAIAGPIDLSTLNTSMYFRVTSAPSSFLGFSISGVGDMNGDGYDDIAIGSCPFRNGQYLTQKAYILHGRPDEILKKQGNRLDIGQWKGSDGVIVTGAGFIVTGVGDLNGDGLGDLMVTSHVGWFGKGNAYITVYPTNFTMPPSVSPSSRPSLHPVTSLPSSLPTIATSCPSSVPSALLSLSFRPTTTRTPTRIPSIRPSTMIPSKKPTLLPSPRPSSAPTTIRPTPPPTAKPFNLVSPPSRRPSIFFSIPSSFPSSVPTEPDDLTIPVVTVEVTSPGAFIPPILDGKANLLIQVNGSITIAGRRGRTVYTIVPSHSDIRLLSFRSSNYDVLNLTYFDDYHAIDDLIYTLNPLTIQLSSRQQLILSSHNAQFFDLDEMSFIFSPLLSKPVSQDKLMDSSVNVPAIAAAVLICIVIFVSIGVVYWRSVKVSKENFTHLNQLPVVTNSSHPTGHESIKKQHPKTTVHIDREENLENNDDNDDTTSNIPLQRLSLRATFETEPCELPVAKDLIIETTYECLPDNRSQMSVMISSLDSSVFDENELNSSDFSISELSSEELDQDQDQEISSLE